MAQLLTVLKMGPMAFLIPGIIERKLRRPLWITAPNTAKDVNRWFGSPTAAAPSQVMVKKPLGDRPRQFLQQSNNLSTNAKRDFLDFSKNIVR
jgi:hypothetical protein